MSDQLSSAQNSCGGDAATPGGAVAAGVGDARARRTGGVRATPTGGAGAAGVGDARATIGAVRSWAAALRREHPAQHADLARGVCIGVSGGADSLALLHALLHSGVVAEACGDVRPRASAEYAGAVGAGMCAAVEALVVDHGLQPGSADVAARAAAQARALGATARVLTAHIGSPGEGPARRERYRLLGEAAAGRPVLIAHTADDDAEGVLLGLTRGSGADSLAGLRGLSTSHPAVDAGAAWVGRPLLRVRRADTEAACADAGVVPWADPHNSDPAYLRSRIRTAVLPHLDHELGTGAREGLIRSARLLREDTDALEAVARELHRAATVESPQVAATPSDRGTRTSAARPGDAVAPTAPALAPQSALADARPGEAVASTAPALAPHSALAVDVLAAHPPALRKRAIRAWLAAAPAAGPAVSAQLEAIDALVTRWRGQGPVSVPWHTIKPDSHPWDGRGSSGGNHPASTAAGEAATGPAQDYRSALRLVVRREQGLLRLDAVDRK